MRKRFVAALISAVIAVTCAICFTACGEAPVDVAGKTFVFVSVVGEYPEGTSDEVKAEWNENFEGTNEAYKDTFKMIFAEDGTWQQTFPDVPDEQMPHGKYVQNGNVLKFGTGNDGLLDSEMTVSGKNLIFKNEITGANDELILTQVQTFKLLEE